MWLYLISYHTTHNQYVTKPIEQYYFSILFLKCEKIRHLSRLSRSFPPFSQPRSLFQVSIYHTSMTFFHILSSSSKRKDGVCTFSLSSVCSFRYKYNIISFLLLLSTQLILKPYTFTIFYSFFPSQLLLLQSRGWEKKSVCKEWIFSDVTQEFFKDTTVSSFIYVYPFLSFRARLVLLWGTTVLNWTSEHKQPALQKYTVWVQLLQTFLVEKEVVSWKIEKTEYLFT